jgi:phosphoenolpyruvate-protein kinase (PTS system EI component)
MYKGTGASPGIAMGKALILKECELIIEKKSIEIPIAISLFIFILFKYK